MWSRSCAPRRGGAAPRWRFCCRSRPVTMVGDRIQIQQVLINLVLNALEAVAELPEPRRRVSVEVEKTAGRVTLVVRDRGARHRARPDAPVV